VSNANVPDGGIAKGMKHAILLDRPYNSDVFRHSDCWGPLIQPLLQIADLQLLRVETHTLNHTKRRRQLDITSAQSIGYYQNTIDFVRCDAYSTNTTQGYCSIGLFRILKIITDNFA
jgi:hypothetical protein